MKQKLPCGSWPSSICSSTVSSSSIRFGDVEVDGEMVYWSESRPLEQGRYVVTCVNGDRLPAPYSASSGVHEYGGGAFVVSKAVIYFVNARDQGIYKCLSDGNIERIYQRNGCRYGCLVVDSQRNCIYAVEEEHLSSNDVINRLVCITDHVKVVHEGHDFYSMLTLHPNCSQLSFVTWDHPNMPWDCSQLWMGTLTDQGTFSYMINIETQAEESMLQPMWDQSGQLYCISDRSNWWNLYRVDGKELVPIHPTNAEYGVPPWQCRMPRYGFLADGRIVSAYTQEGIDYLGVLDPFDVLSFQTIDLGFTSYQYVRVVGMLIYAVVASPTRVRTLIKYCMNTQKLEILKAVSEEVIDPEGVSLPEALTCVVDEKCVHGFYYPPRHADIEPLDKPPLIVKVHGGPTAHVSPVLNIETQFWTSRGFAVLDINYRGSTGYGREYRCELNGLWGVLDVKDCCCFALSLARQGRVDGERMTIKGSSSGGYTALLALTLYNVFSAGVSYYGISDLKALLDVSHKFELHYLDRLIGEYSTCKELYLMRSPLYHVDKLSKPVLLLQGSKDCVVPPSQSEQFFEQVRKRHIPVSYIVFEGEKHGFRKSQTIQKAVDAELYFYRTIFHILSDEVLDPIDIHNR